MAKSHTSPTFATTCSTSVWVTNSVESALRICATPCSLRCRAVAYTLMREFTRLSLSSFGQRALQSDAHVMAGWAQLMLTASSEARMPEAPPTC
ncbi:unnamed protein product [Symbiodinium sp. KB8]|nr:unnamed protein product [Symbiodinium sp. KB8]